MSPAGSRRRHGDQLLKILQMLLIGVFAAVRGIVVPKIERTHVPRLQHEPPTRAPKPERTFFPWQVAVFHVEKILTNDGRKVDVCHMKGRPQQILLTFKAAINIRLIEARIRRDRLRCRFIQPYSCDDTNRALNKGLSDVLISLHLFTSLQFVAKK